jgi:hypothetical protein
MHIEIGRESSPGQRESWSGASTASLSIELPGKPGRFDGSIALAPRGDGTVETVAGEVRVTVPMIGKKLEALVGDLLGAALDAEQRVGRAYLAGGG